MKLFEGNRSNMIDIIDFILINMGLNMKKIDSMSLKAYEKAYMKVFNTQTKELFWMKFCFMKYFTNIL